MEIGAYLNAVEGGLKVGLAGTRRACVVTAPAGVLPRAETLVCWLTGKQ